MTLPVQNVLPDLLGVLRSGSNAVLVAPPGAGKTTAVAPALLHEDWCSGQILLLSPRRLAARAAAERISQMLGEPVGSRVGYATRMDSRHGKNTRILVLTEGIFRNRIQDDPELAGISAVLFDEVHERSLDSDFGLALALDVQGALRPDLRLVAMSATLDGARFATLMENAPVLESAGRSYPLVLRHIGRQAEKRLEDDMAAAIRLALREEGEGDVLAFLPGVGEIERTAERLHGLGEGVVVHKLHGSLDPADQRRAIMRDGSGRRKIILSTNIAETSLTIDGVRIVVDCGFARRARYDRAAGVTRLVTEKASQAAVTQRAGRAARQSAGVAYRLWEAAATNGMPPYDPPEILESDLSSLLLDCAMWGVTDLSSLRWLDAPPVAAVSEARARLCSLGAIDRDWRITVHGRAVAALPIEPRLAHMLLRAGQMGMGTLAANIAVLLGERGVGGNDVDISHRLDRWRSERGRRADAARLLADRWAKIAGGKNGDLPPYASGICIALAFPDRIAKRRSSDGSDWISAGGRGFRLEPASSLAREEWLAVADVQGSSAGARILSAAPISADVVESLFADRIETVRTVGFRSDAGGVEALRMVKLGAIQLSSGSDDAPDKEQVAQALFNGVRDGGIALLPWSERSLHLMQRADFAGMDSLSASGLAGDLAEWLPPLLIGKRRLRDIHSGDLGTMLESRLGWDERRRLDTLAPEMFETPAGTQHRIDYSAEGGPSVEVRVQALYGLTDHPCIGVNRIALRLSLTSPAGRPIQTTADLPAFWKGSWRDVAKEMRGRYPRHNWPDDPVGAKASLRTKNAQAREKS
jgi:ATP-dependent helicase HrpB